MAHRDNKEQRVTNTRNQDVAPKKRTRNLEDDDDDLRNIRPKIKRSLCEYAVR
ncbi:hypothetical protein PVAP13_2NG452906 [Panicum virgatum]|uniref:Uncharacterized protein n=1 Tax=Panicum virgatum TaxID=38727 RepID=A0A8T0VI91_PANVG|nr:hypothetical protein PVAP13_2NG452906 [Panicum virgatum]